MIMRRIFKWSKRLLIATTTLLILLSLIGAIYQWTATRRTERLHPPPGKLIDVGGHRLHILTRGSGGPSVVIEDGLIGASFYWDSIGAEIARFAQVTTYDRAGLG